ncbi:ATP-grasp domain-containing protein [Pseudomonas sp. SJZ080]|uniref:ATP-grasp domain-containing protein n=1 Tax=Pseudomonas sp. SJZ080 TaxID=2572888 RepID=UPI0021142732|nr:ATP-grasp domain-containing protein [Pseudomonas sp. SJZ080]
MNGSQVRMKRGACNVLVTSASRKAPLVRAMQEAVRRINPDACVFAGDLDPEAPARYVADGFWQMPRITDAELPALIQGCHERGIAVVFPTRDGELLFWARHRAALSEAGISVIVSHPEAVERCLDKLAFADFGREGGLAVINAATTPEAVGAGPYVVKERYGAGSRAIGLDLSLDAARLHGKNLDAPIYQPFVPGPEISIDGWIDRGGSVVGVVLRRRDRVSAGESQITTTFRSEALEREAVRALETLDLRGPVVMQAIVVNDTMRIIECNPRFGGASTTAIAVGLDVLYWSLAEAFDQGLPPVFKRIAGEVRQVRLPTDLVLHDPDF